MQYVDLGTLKPIRKKPSPIKRFLKLAAFSAVFLFCFYLLILFLLPGTTLKSVLTAPTTALGLINDPLKQLKSTSGRTNILVLGIDKRKDIPYSYKIAGGKTAYNGFNTDTMLIASINLTTKEVTMISLPRDIWVDFGGSNGLAKQSAKINSIYATGQTQDYPGGGLALVKQVVTNKLGLQIHYAVRVDFEAFRQMVNSVGGVDITVENKFDDYEYPIEGKENALCGTQTVISPEGTSEAIPDYSCRYEALHFKTGLMHMDGDTALKFVRSRHGNNGEGSDFARAARQQKVIVGLKNKALSLQTLLDPIKIARLASDFGETIETDFDLAAIPGLIKIGKDFDDSKLHTVVLDDPKVIIHPDPADYGGAWVLVPKDPTWEAVKTYIKEVIANPAIISPSTTPTPSPAGKTITKTPTLAR